MDHHPIRSQSMPSICKGVGLKAKYSDYKKSLGVFKKISWDREFNLPAVVVFYMKTAILLGLDAKSYCLDIGS